MSVTAALVRPPVDVLHKFSKPVECLALGYLAAGLRVRRHDAVLIDGMLYDWSVQKTAEEIIRSKPDIVGFTVVLNHFPEQVEQISLLLRESGFSGPIVVGGHAVSFYPDRILASTPVVDAVVCGEGELAIADIADAVANGADWTATAGVVTRGGSGIVRRGVQRVTDIDLLGNPARDLTQAVIDNDGLAAMSTSRGCYARCNFCSIPRFYGLERGGKGLASGDWLGRPADSMAAEVLDLHERFGLLELLIVDDEFFGGSEVGFDRAVEFGDRLSQAGAPVGLTISFRAENARESVLTRLMEGGLQHCFIGLESGVDEDLKLYGKGQSADQNAQAVRLVKKLGLSFQPGFMMFHYDSSIRQLRRNMEFLRSIGECKPVTVNSAVDPHFGAPITRVMNRAGVVDDHGTRMTMRYRDPRVHTVRRVAELAADAFREYMNIIATLQSAITYEWRRVVPGRDPEVARALDAFEATVNDKFVRIVDESLDLVERDPQLPADEAMAWAKERTDQVRTELRLPQSLLLMLLQRREGEPRYWTQRELIDARR